MATKACEHRKWEVRNWSGTGHGETWHCRDCGKKMTARDLAASMKRMKEAKA